MTTTIASEERNGKKVVLTAEFNVATGDYGFTVRSDYKIPFRFETKGFADAAELYRKQLALISEKEVA